MLTPFLRSNLVGARFGNGLRVQASEWRCQSFVFICGNTHLQPRKSALFIPRGRRGWNPAKRPELQERGRRAEPPRQGQAPRSAGFGNRWILPVSLVLQNTSQSESAAGPGNEPHPDGNRLPYDAGDDPGARSPKARRIRISFLRSSTRRLSTP